MKFFKNIFSAIFAVVLLLCTVWGICSLYPLKYVEEIREYSSEWGVDPYFVAAVIKAESNFDPKALSVAGAKGLMQLTDETADFCSGKVGLVLGEGDIYEPDVNIRLGVYYLDRMLELFDSDRSLAVAAYNAGEGRVRQWLANGEYSADGKSLHTIPYEETRNHVKKIEGYMKIYKILYPNL